MDKNTKGRAGCLQCEHYFITWAPKAPRGCRLYGFKSAALPSTVVKRTSGVDCQGFTPKKRSGGA